MRFSNDPLTDKAIPAAPPLPRRRRRSRIAVASMLVLAAMGTGGYFIRAEIQARGHEREALAAIDKRDFKLALHHLEYCREAWPKNADIVFLTARTARRAGDFPAAERYLNEAERLGWDEKSIFLERALQFAQQGGFAEAEPYLLKCVRSDHPDSTIIVEVIAPLYMKTFNTAKASEMLEIWFQRDAKHPIPHILQGDLFKRLSQTAKAADSYREAHRLDPDNAEARQRLSAMLVEMNDFQPAFEHLQWLVARNNADREDYLNLARCQVALGREEEARQVLNRLAQETPDDAAVLAERGKLELRDSHADRAERWLRRAAELEPFDPIICHNFALCLEQLGKSGEANTYRERTKQIEESLKRIAQLMRAITANPGDPELRREAGVIMIRHKKISAGLRWLQTALEQDPNHGPTHQALADHFQSTGDWERAAYHQRMATGKPR